LAICEAIMIGLVLVSHSRALAEAAVDLIRRTVSDALPIAAAGGVGETHSEIGTDTIDIQQAIESVAQPDGVLVLMDMGSAILSAEMAKDLLGDSINVRLCSGPLVEGGIAAAVQIQAGSPVADVVAAAQRSLLPKQDQLGESVEIAETAAAPAVAEETFESVLENVYGLHLRPVAALIKSLGPDAKNVRLENLTGKRGPVVAASLVEIARLQGKKGDTIRFMLSGSNTARIRKEIESFLDQLAHEDVRPATPAKEESIRLEPIAVSPGLAVGRVFFDDQVDVKIPETRPNTPEEVDAECQRLTEAIAAAQQNAGHRVAKFRSSLNSADLAILEAQQLILSDETLLGKAQELIRTKPANAAAAWYRTLTEVAEDQAQAADDYLRQRAIDFREAASAVVQQLIGQTPRFANLGEDCILVCPELTPTLIDQIQSTRVMGVIELAGGSLSHGAILARSIGLPAIGNAARSESLLRSARLVAIDGTTGQLLVDPPAEVVQEWRQKQMAARELHEKAVQLSQVTAASIDQVPFLIMANAGKRRDVELALHNGADGIGLFRSEFLFDAFQTLPSEEDQLAAYRNALDPILAEPRWNSAKSAQSTGSDGGQSSPAEFSVTLRLLDIGGDKPLPFLSPGKESNPFLGVRGLRLLLRNPVFFESHLSAILRLAQSFSIKLLVPMVTSVAEIFRLKQYLGLAHQSLQGRNIPHQWPIEIGVMIETPAAAVAFDQMIEHLDFASIGTNDLTQYVLSAERGNPQLEEFADSLHPAVLRLCQEVIALANQRKLPISICGEIASDPVAVPLLAGLGLRVLSVAPTAVPTIKATIRALNLSEMTSEKITNLLGQQSAAEIREALRSV
jgi:multiphosphoryl transfer protein